MGGELRPFAFSMSALKHLRRRRLYRLSPFSGHEVSDHGFNDERDIIRLALKQVPPDQAVVLVLHYAHGFSRSEIADFVDRSEEAVKSRLARGKANFIAAYSRAQRGLR